MSHNLLVRQGAKHASVEGGRPKWRRRAYVFIAVVKLAELIGRLVDWFFE